MHIRESNYIDVDVNVTIKIREPKCVLSYDIDKRYRCDRTTLRPKNSFTQYEDHHCYTDRRVSCRR